MKRKIISAVLAALLLVSLCPEAAADGGPSVSAKSAVLVCGGYTMYNKNADMRLPMASTTKLMTAIVALEHCNIDGRVKIKGECCNVEGSSMYLSEGDVYTVKELVTGLLLVSGNDAALALADYVAGGTAQFAALMNQKAASLGMTNTHFTNPHGLSDAGHYSTARDLAQLMLYCMNNPVFAEITAMKSCNIKGLTLVNHNRLLSSLPSCVGGKTGFTEAAGRCLVSCCEQNGARFVCVTLCAPDDWNDHAALYNWAYSRCSMRSITKQLRFSVPVITGERRWAYLVPESEIELFLPSEVEITLSAELPWFVFAPVEKDRKGGNVTVSVDGKCVAEYYLVYADAVLMKSKE